MILNRFSIGLFCILLASGRLAAQAPNNLTQQKLIKTVSNDFHTSLVHGAFILSALQYNTDKIVAVIKNKSLTPQERSSKITTLEMERQAKIKATLTAPEIQRLQELKIIQRQQRLADHQKGIPLNINQLR